VALFVFALWFSGCGPKPPQGEPRYKTTPVTGIVQIDGQPVAGVIVTFVVEPGTSELARNATAQTDEEGQFAATTYTKDDGLPAGTYALTFKWKEVGFAKGDRDKLKSAYANPKSSQTKVTVEDDVPQDLGIIELSTKKTPAKS
jgi:hypothetical protein